MGTKGSTWKKRDEIFLTKSMPCYIGLILGFLVYVYTIFCVPNVVTATPHIGLLNHGDDGIHAKVTDQWGDV